MDGVIVADKTGKELRALTFDSYDIEVGTTENSFQFVIKRPDYQTIPKWSRIYIPGTEYGGLFQRLETNTKDDTIRPGGYTWRGMMQNKIIEPPSGADYATDSGELNAIIKARVEAAFPGLFIGSSDSTGMTVNWSYDRYCTLEEGLRKMLKSVGYRMSIEYSQTDKAVLVCAVPIEDYSDEIELSSDMRLNYIMDMQGDGVNHLILLGQGDLRNRVVRHLYINADGNISTSQYYTGIEEVAAVYDYAGAEVDDLMQSGQKRLEELANQNSFSMTVDTDMEIGIGDIVGGRDYLSGMTMTAPIKSKIIKWSSGYRTTEYEIEDDVQATIEISENSLKLEKLDIDRPALKPDLAVKAEEPAAEAEEAAEPSAEAEEETTQEIVEGNEEAAEEIPEESEVAE